MEKKTPKQKKIEVSINDAGINEEEYTSDHSFFVEFLVPDSYKITEQLRDDWPTFLAFQLESYLNKRKQ